MVKKLYPKLPENRREKVVRDHDAIIIHETIKYIKPIKGAKAALKNLKKKYKIAIVSNSKRKEIYAALRKVRIDRNSFDCIVGSDQVKHPKPAPDMLEKAKRILKTNKGYMIGDAIYDIQAGKKAHLKTVAVHTGNHTKKELLKEKPNMILKSIAQLPKKL